MITDTYTQIWSSPEQLGPEMASMLRRRQSEQWGQFEGNPAMHEKEMSGVVDASLIFGLRADRLDAHVPNEFIADYVARDPMKRAGIAGIDPMRSDAPDQVNVAVEMGFVGIAISPMLQGFHPSHSDAISVYEQCVDTGLPLFVMFSDPLPGSAMLEFGRPSLWDEVCRMFPNLHVIFNQLGYPWIDETLTMLGKHEHVFADISGVASRPWELYNLLLSASNQRLMDKLLFASGFPRATPAKVIETLYTINGYSHGTQLPSIPRSQIRSVIERDVFSVLKMESDAAPTSASSEAAATAARSPSRTIDEGAPSETHS